MRNHCLPSKLLPAHCLQLLLGLWLCLLLPSMAAAEGGPLTLSQASGSYPLGPVVEFLEDPDGRLTAADLRRPDLAARFRQPQLGHNDLNFGYSSSVYWLRLQLSAEQSSRWLLEVAFPSLDRVELYTDTSATPLVAGDLQAFAERPIAHRNLVFPVDLAAHTPTTLLLRVQSAGTLTVPLTLWQPAAFEAYNQRTYAALAVYYGALAALFGYNLLLFFATRDRSFLEYVLCVAGMAIGQLSLNGFGNQFVWPAWPAWGNVALPIGFAICGLFGAMFTRTFLDTRHNAPRLDRVIVAFIALFAFTAIAPALFPYRVGAALISILGISFSALAVLCGVRCLQRQAPGARFYLLAWTLLLIGVGIMGARNLGLLPTNFLTSYAMQLGSSLEMLLLSFALADRINIMRRAKELAQSDALAANQRMLSAVQRNEQELEERVRERTQALAEANNRLLENEKLLQRMVQHDALTGLANRLLLDDRLEHALIKAQRNGSRMAVLLIDLDGFKPVNDTHGHAIGDQLLLMVAERLRGGVREADTVARLGGDEFVVLLEDGRDDSHFERIAALLVGELSQPYGVGKHQVIISASIGIAGFPADGDEAQTLLKHADQAMYLAKAAGRNCFRNYSAVAANRP